ncbi:DNA photolyase family protein [bacterium]|nr:DNA photolyase family protein [bacterium]
MNSPQKKEHIAIMWYRRDLRLEDNRAFYEAVLFSRQQDVSLLPIFIFDTSILAKLDRKSDRRISFIWDCLSILKKDLRTKKNDLAIITGKPIEIFETLSSQYEISAVFCNEDYDSYSTNRDQKIETLLKQKNSSLNLFKDHVIFSKNDILKKDKTPYKVFTPYKRKWLEKVTDRDIKDYTIKDGIPKIKVDMVEYYENLPSFVSSFEQLGFKVSEITATGGSDLAELLFKKFLKLIENYSGDRDFYNNNATSSLSPYLRFGCISIRSIVATVLRIPNNGAKTWLSELIWREFYNMILFQFPHVEYESFKPKYRRLNYPGTQLAFEKWKSGHTGVPVIDAAMRCFNRTGCMHNRLRMIVASFLVKDLLVDWKLGERYFAENLLDYDLASNNGGWQWAASTGCDSQPYFRIFNPYTQSKKFDPDGKFLRQELPELKSFPSKFIHEPQLAPKTVQKHSGCIIGKHYPKPIVDHKAQREKALKLYKRIDEV